MFGLVAEKLGNELRSFNMITLRMKKNPLSCLMQLLVLNDEIMDYEYGLMGPGILVFVVSFVSGQMECKRTEGT